MHRRVLAVLFAFVVALGLQPLVTPRAAAAPGLTVAVGSFQSELGCSGDWQPDCTKTQLTDPDADGVWTLETTALPAASYEAKVALNGSWDENYGAGGVLNGPNIGFTVTEAGQKVTLRYDASSHVLTILAGHGADNNVEWDGVAHDSRDLLYRTPGGAVPAGTPVTLRVRTLHDDVTGVALRVHSLNKGQSVVAMTKAAAGVSCYDAKLASQTCDFWAATIPASHGADNLWYRFVVTDGADTDYLADDTAALDGGAGKVTDDAVDTSWALMLHVPGYAAPAWARDAMVYQIFPDRFRNGRANNDPKTGDVRYDDPVRRMTWDALPEGYCRNYTDGDTNCPWRFDDTPPNWSPTKEGPRGRDYYGGDLKGVDQQLDYLKSLGINTIYLNPVFDAGSNHGYDTQDYYRIDPYFGTQKDFDNLVKHAHAMGIRVVLDGVFNHMSSDSPIFDRYHHYPTVGACESVDSPYRSWFTFVEDAAGPCAGPNGTRMRYEGWFGFDSIPVLTKSKAEVQAYFLTSRDSVAKHWLRAGADGWRLDVSGDASFPDGYWQTFRTATKAVAPNSLSIGETWQKDSALLRSIRGDQLDTTMNYRIRDAVLGLLAPQSFDSKGFADSGRKLTASEFANRLASVREDYPDAAYYSLLNILDSHDTERALWTLTAGPETRAGRENPAALAAGKARLRLASLIQFTQAGMPTVYYGDEAGVTGDDDPDDRRTYPWADLGGSPDKALISHYTALTSLRNAEPALRTGDFRVLLADDAASTVAYGRKTQYRGGIVALNTSDAARTLSIPVGGYLPEGTRLTVVFGVGVATRTTATVSEGVLKVALPANAGAWLATGDTDLLAPAAPKASVAAEASRSVTVAWQPVRGAVGYQVYASPVTGGGWVQVTSKPVSGSSYTVSGLDNSRQYFFVVRALDFVGNASEPSNEVTAIPHPRVAWANLQWPPTISHTISAVNRTPDVSGQVFIEGATASPGATPGLVAQLGYGPVGSVPGAGWTWVDARFNTDAGNNDEFAASLLPERVGTYDYVYRYSVTGGRDWLVADQSGLVAAGAAPGKPGRLTVAASTDATAPSVPTGLSVVSRAPTAIGLEWHPVVGDATLHGYEIGRRAGGTGEFVVVGASSGASFVDQTVSEGGTYSYAVRSVDTSLNRSGWSAQVSATAELRKVTAEFTVTVPATTEATGRTVHIAGSLDTLDGGLPAWNPGGVKLTRVDATHWRVQVSGLEGTAVEYKYALGDWEHGEKDATCGEIGNRQVTLTYGTDGVHKVADTVVNWRNVAPCGN